MEYKIQSLIFPTEGKHQQCKQLFYRGESGYLDREEKMLLLAKGQNVDFVTYLNACSYRKWKTYTNINGVVLYLDIIGSFQLLLLGYSKNIMAIEREEFGRKEYHLEKRQIIKFEFPENNDQMLGFEICALGDCTIFGGYYTAICDKEDLNDVCLCLATTTCHKEEFIKKNVNLLKKEILESEEDIKDNFYIHVMDNGKSLTKEDINGRHVNLHPNNNTGGSGGFSRGMMESLNQEPKATHVLLMDDDVLILPESIVRTYNLLKLMKEEYKKSFISGAMLYYEEPFRQHEDIGTITDKCHFRPLKRNYDHNFLNDNLENEGEFVKQKNEYAGWWYCCIPTQIIEEYGLSLPLFIRGDDIEYSLRCKADILTMNGICIWHMGFTTKYNGAFDKYQRCRNFLIGKSCSNILQNINMMEFILRSYRSELLKFNYDTAELLIRAFEDYLKGPEFLKEDNGEKIVKENSKLNDQMISLNKLDGGDIEDLFSCYYDPPRKFLDKWLFRITYNGQRFWPTAWCRKDYAYIAFDDSYQPQKMSMHNRLIAVNPFTKTGKLREMDKARFKELQSRFKKAWKYYARHKVEIESEYRKEMPNLTSMEFWRNYLGI